MIIYQFVSYIIENENAKIFPYFPKDYFEAMLSEINIFIQLCQHIKLAYFNISHVVSEIFT